MECPNCHIKMTGDFCIRCGYIDEDTHMKDHQINFEKSDLEKYLKNDYVKILYNQNKKAIFILGPLYLAYREHFYLSFILGIFDILIMFFSGYLFQSTLMMVMTFIIIHFLYVMFCNPLYIYLTNRFIRKVKKRFPEDYENIFRNKKSKNLFLPFLVLLCYVVLFIFITYINIK